MKLNKMNKPESFSFSVKLCPCFSVGSGRKLSQLEYENIFNILKLEELSLEEEFLRLCVPKHLVEQHKLFMLTNRRGFPNEYDGLPLRAKTGLNFSFDTTFPSFHFY